MSRRTIAVRSPKAGCLRTWAKARYTNRPSHPRRAIDWQVSGPVIRCVLAKPGLRQPDGWLTASAAGQLLYFEACFADRRRLHLTRCRDNLSTEPK
jgi:hypothetical protein